MLHAIFIIRLLKIGLHLFFKKIKNKSKTIINLQIYYNKVFKIYDINLFLKLKSYTVEENIGKLYFVNEDDCPASGSKN